MFTLLSNELQSSWLAKLAFATFALGALVFWVWVIGAVIALVFLAKTGRRGAFASVMWPLWVPVLVLNRMYRFASLLPVSFDDFSNREWRLWGRAFCQAASSGVIDMGILTEDPNQRALDQLALASLRHGMRGTSTKH